MADQSLDIADEVQYVIGSVFVWLGPKIRMSVFLVFAAELKININSVTVIFGILTVVALHFTLLKLA